MNLNLKTMPMMVVSLLAASSIFGQMKEQECKPCNPCQPPPVCKPVPPPKCGPLQAPQPPIVCAYNAPAEIFIGMECDLDIIVTASFLYWQPTMDNMSIGFGNENDLFIPGGVIEPTIEGDYINMDFDFKPGFQVGLGMNLVYDDWVAYMEYTRVHGKHHASSKGPNSSAPSVFATWGAPWLMADDDDLTAGQVFDNVSASYKNHLDIGDIEMSRVYYVGKRLIFHSAFGARAAWILQSLKVKYENEGTHVPSTDPAGIFRSNPEIVTFVSRTHSWGVGPRAGLIMDWVLGCGWRFYGSTYADILYTKYKLQNKTTLVAFTGTTTGPNAPVGVPVSMIDKDVVRVLRTHLDMEMGIGWGDYWDTNDYHFDFSIGYGFQVFFDQNMFRHYLSNEFLGANLVDQGNLYIQGLNVTARIDF